MTTALTTDALQTILDTAPFHVLLGLRIEAVNSETDTVVIRLPFRPEFERLKGSGNLHGGIIASLIDVAGDFALVAILGRGIPTIDLRIDYLRPAMHTDLIASAAVRRCGKSIGNVDVTVTGSAGKIIALGRGVYATAKM
jgi:uncharacterized protein (TIGR00369 family)